MIWIGQCLSYRSALISATIRGQARSRGRAAVRVAVDRLDLTVLDRRVCLDDREGDRVDLRADQRSQSSPQEPFRSVRPSSVEFIHVVIENQPTLLANDLQPRPFGERPTGLGRFRLARVPVRRLELMHLGGGNLRGRWPR